MYAIGMMPKAFATKAGAPIVVMVIITAVQTLLSQMTISQDPRD